MDRAVRDQRICGRVAATQFIYIARSFALTVVMTIAVIILILLTKLLPLNLENLEPTQLFSGRKGATGDPLVAKRPYYKS